MTNAPAVSIIIPMYNAEKYIAECLESLLIQTLQDFEVIVVDDCSSDNSCAVVESYAEKFGGRLKLAHMEKISGSGALPRNKGLRFSRGEYLFFVDADDLLTPTALEELYTLAQNFTADVVYCQKHYEADSNTKNFRLVLNHEGKFFDKPTFEPENLAERVKKIIAGEFCGTPWCKFVRRDLLVEHEIFFPHCKISEDELWSYGLLFWAKKFLRVPNAVYISRQSEDSISRIRRTPAQEINFWLNPLIKGLKLLDDLMGKFEFFRRNPKYRCALLENFVHTRFSCVFKASQKLQLLETYTGIRNEFGKDFGEHDVLLSFLLADLIEQQKIFVGMLERIAELEKSEEVEAWL